MAAAPVNEFSEEFDAVEFYLDRYSDDDYDEYYDEDNY